MDFLCDSSVGLDRLYGWRCRRGLCLFAEKVRGESGWAYLYPEFADIHFDGHGTVYQFYVGPDLDPLRSPQTVYYHILDRHGRLFGTDAFNVELLVFIGHIRRL